MTTSGGGPSAAGPAPLDLLYETRRGGRPVVAGTFLTLCWLVTVPSLLLPRLYDVLGGIGPWRWPWQPFTAVLEHGWPGSPGIVHLGLNTVLIVEAGFPCERLLGRARFLGLCVASAAANAAAQALTEGVNGSSLVIWSWGPCLALALVEQRRLEQNGRSMRAAHASRLLATLVLMYVVVTAAMTLLPYAAGWSGNPLAALLLGNRYHLVATAVGLLAAVVLRRAVRERLGAVLS